MHRSNRGNVLRCNGVRGKSASLPRRPISLNNCTRDQKVAGARRFLSSDICDSKMMRMMTMNTVQIAKLHMIMGRCSKQENHSCRAETKIRTFIGGDILKPSKPEEPEAISETVWSSPPRGLERQCLYEMTRELTARCHDRQRIGVYTSVRVSVSIARTIGMVRSCEPAHYKTCAQHACARLFDLQLESSTR